jgi:tetratricopeptide (TPR) repeat protein
VSNVASFKYKAFLSYSHRDKNWGEWLHRALENYKIDKDLVGRETAVGPVPKTLRPIFRDRDDFAAGHSLTEQTLAALDASQFLIVVCSRNAAKSQYVNEEIRRFKALGRAERLIAIIVDGEPGDAERECFPPALRFKIGADGAITEEREEPIAADARRQGDGKHLALQKVVAALIAVPLDELRKRYEIMWRRKTTIGTLIGLSMAALALVTGFLALQHGWQQEHQTQRDRELREHMEQQRQQAATQGRLIETLTAQLTKVGGGQATAPGADKAVGEAVAAAVEGAAAGDVRLAKALELLQAGKPKEAEPLFRAVAEEKERAASASNKEAAAAYRNLGAIAGLGDPMGARAAYAKAAALDPGDPEGLFWHGWFQWDAGNLRQAEDAYRSLIALDGRGAKPSQIFWARSGLGDIAMARGDLRAALLAYREVLAIAERLAADNPKDYDWQRNLSVSYDRVGDALVAQGNLPEALKSFRDSLAIAGRLAQADPGKAGRQRDLSVSYNKVGDVLVAQGNLPEALKSFRDSLAIAGRLAQAEPGNAGWQRDLSVSHNKVGDVLVAQGNLREALTSFRDSLALADRLAKADPGNAGWQRDLSVSYERVGDVLVKQGNLPEALKSFRDSLAIRDRLAKAEPGNAGWQYDLGVGNERVGNVLMAQGDLAAALKSYQARQTIISRLAKADPGNASWQRDLSVSYNKVGDVLAAQGNLPEALKSFRADLAIAERLAKTDPGNAGWQRDLSVSHSRIGGLLMKQERPAEALQNYRADLAIAERLAAMDPSNAEWQSDVAISHRQILAALRKIGIRNLTAEQTRWLLESEAKLAALTKQ